MRILMAQNAPCIRNYKETVALTKRGHEVHLACSANRLTSQYGVTDWNEWYRSVIPLYKPEELLDVADWFDVVHCHNEPDTFAAAMSISETPSIHDCHDMMSARGLGFNIVEEGIANKFSNARIFVSDYQRARAHHTYKLDDHLSAVCRTMVLEQHIPTEPLPKLSKGTGEIHYVYEGGLSGSRETHRWMLPHFKELIEAGAWVHVYAFCTDDCQALYMRDIDSPRLVFHDTLGQAELLREMTQYDAGLCLFNMIESNKHHLHSTLPNKLFEYLCAGIPVICSRFHEMEQFVKDQTCGLLWTNAEEIVALTKDAVPMFRIESSRYTMESEISTVEALYEGIVSSPKPDLSAVNFNPVDFAEVKAQRSLQFNPPDGSKLIRRSLVGREPSEATLRVEAIVSNNALGDL